MTEDLPAAVRRVDQVVEVRAEAAAGISDQVFLTFCIPIQINVLCALIVRIN